MEAAIMPADNSLNLFLDLILANKPDDAYVLIWTFETTEDVDHKRSYWCQSKSQVLSTITKIQKQGRHIYIGCGWTLKEHGSHERAISSEIDGVPGKWFDLDIHHSIHKKSKNDILPPNIPTAIKALKDITPEPTIVVSSGYGLHVWWLYEQPWMFEDSDDRKRAEQLSQAWQKYIKARLKQLGWASDTTSDLARVLRPPGTYNYKVADDPKPVEIIHTTDSRYSPDALREWLKTHDKGIVTNLIPNADLSGSSDFILRPDAEPPASKWRALLALDITVGEHWDHTKKAGDDISQTGWDSSLACDAARAGDWSDQEIANLIIANRREHTPNDLKLDNRNYFERTIKHAREHASKSQFAFLEDEKEVHAKLALDDNEYARNPFDDDQAVKALSVLNRWFDIGEFDAAFFDKKKLDADDEPEPKPETSLKPALTKIICYTSDPAMYYLELYNREGELRRVKVGDGNDIRDQRKWSRVIWDERGHDIRKIERDKWQTAIRLIARVMIRESPGIEGTEGGMVMSWIHDHVGPKVKVIENMEDRYECLRRLTPFIERGYVYFSMPVLAQYIRTHRGKNVDEKTLTVMLRGLGGESKAMNFKLSGDDRFQKRRLWCVPWDSKNEIYSSDYDPDDAIPDQPIRNVKEHTFEEI